MVFIPKKHPTLTAPLHLQYHHLWLLCKVFPCCVFYAKTWSWWHWPLARWVVKLVALANSTWRNSMTSFLGMLAKICWPFFGGNFPSECPMQKHPKNTWSPETLGCIFTHKKQEQLQQHLDSELKPWNGPFSVLSDFISIVDFYQHQDHLNRYSWKKILKNLEHFKKNQMFEKSPAFVQSPPPKKKPFLSAVFFVFLLLRVVLETWFGHTSGVCRKRWPMFKRAFPRLPTAMAAAAKLQG